MGDANPIHTLGDYSRPSHEGYRNTIELPEGNNVVPLRSDTIRITSSIRHQSSYANGCSFHGLQSEDPNQHLKFHAPTWEDLTTLFLVLNSSTGRTAKLRNDILMFQQHQGESLSEAWNRQTIDQSASGKLCDTNAEESWALLEYLALYDNESWNDPRDFAKPVKAISLPQDVSSTSDHRLIELEHQVQCLMEAHIDPMQPTQVNKITSSCEICSGPHDTQYYMEDPEQPFVEYASSQQNRNPSSPKRVHFVNLIIILNKEDEDKEEGSVGSSVTEYKNHEMTVEAEEEVESKEEFKEETEEEIEEEEEDNPEYFDTFPTMKELRLHYNWIMSKRLEPRRKPSNPKKICNFMGRVRGLKVFVGNFTYICDFVVLEDTTSIIDHDLGSVIFGKPFVKMTGLAYDIKEGTAVFEKDKEKIMFKMPHKMEMFKHIDFTNIKTDRIPPFVIRSDDDNSEETHYSNSLDLGPEYKYDENVCRTIWSLIAMKARRNEGKVM
ncbi:hypothetical protein Tco_0852104 [Tanacetum coccineum]